MINFLIDLVFILLGVFFVDNRIDQYRVIKVYDGDTLTGLNLKTNAKVRIRLKCVDAPEWGQSPWDEMAHKRLLELTPLDSIITIHGNRTDRYRRTLGIVENYEGKNVNMLLALEGLAVYYHLERGCKEYDEYQTSAQTNRNGMWSQSCVVIPYDYRKNRNAKCVKFR